MGKTWKIKTSDQHAAALDIYARGHGDVYAATILNALHGCEGIKPNGCGCWRRKHRDEIQRRREEVIRELAATLTRAKKTYPRAA